jgi:hypothetical protein
MKRIIILINLFLLINMIYAQQMNIHEKKIEYQQRLYKQFLHMDTVDGGCVPAAKIWPEKSCEDAWILGNICKGKGMVAGEYGIMDWSDGNVHLAQYIAWLGTEYKIQVEEKKQLSQIRKEISYALFATERLDKASALKYNMPVKETGFLLRDDAPTDISKHFEGLHCVKSGKVCRTGTGDGNLMSQDQVIYLLWSFAILKELTPDTMTSFINGKNLHEIIAKKTALIIQSFSKKDWMIYDPYGDKVSLGNNATGYSIGIARLGKIITKKGFNNAHSIFNGWPIWATLMLLDYEKNPIQNEVNMGMQLAMTSVIGSPSYYRFKNWCTGANMEIYLLIDALFRKRNVEEWKETFHQMLVEAPENGPCFKTKNCSNAEGWSGENRWFHPDLRNGIHYETGAAFNGLDYLLLYNLYKIHYE